MYFGQSLLRREDIRFLKGKGRYTDDLNIPHTAYVSFVRSDRAHARLKSLLLSKAKKMPGVLSILTAKDWKQDSMGKLVCVHPMPFSDGRPMNEKLRPLFVEDKVCHVGDIIACVIAESKFEAMDAVEEVRIEYEDLPYVTEVKNALHENAPVIHKDIGSNLVFEIFRGNEKENRKVFDQASHITELNFNINRVAGNPLEPRSFIAHYEEENDHYTLWCTSQIPHYFRRWLSKYVLFEAENRIQVISPDVGGGFGLKIHLTEGAIVTWASKKVGRPVKWTATRSESFISDTQARDHYTKARMAFDKNGKILGMEVDTVAALGGYLSQFAPSIPGNSYPQTITGLYQTPALFLRVRGAYSNTLPVDAYRGSGRPEATFINERLLENGAREMGMDVVEIRHKNLIPSEFFPYKTPVGRTYDCGDPPALFEKLMNISNYKLLREEQKSLREKGIFLGIGIACFLDKSGTGSSQNLASKGGLHGGYECAVVRVHSDGKVTVFSGSHSHGQGHDTAFCQIAADVLGISIDDIRLVQGDTNQVPFGNGTWGSRSASVGGPAIVLAAQKVLKKAKALAAHLLESAVEDMEYQMGVFRVRGTDRSIRFSEIADVAYHGSKLPNDGSISPGLDETVFYEPTDTNDPEAMHLVVVIVDGDTGVVSVRDYFTSDDCGRIINPMIVEGQIHGGLGQGIGQAMMEQIIYEKGSKGTGQLLTGSFLDYAMPRASDMPQNITLVFQEIPCPSNILGVKGGSETGTIGPPAAIGNAVVDALWHLGVGHIELPITAEKVWRALQNKNHQEL